jgi:hypothetical protein
MVCRIARPACGMPALSGCPCAGLVCCASEHMAAVRAETGGNLVAGRNKEAARSRASAMYLRYTCCRGV